jgi:hypothetical protein
VKINGKRLEKYMLRRMIKMKKKIDLLEKDMIIRII